MRTERAEFVAELLRKHRHGPVDKVDRSSPCARLLINDGAGLHIVGDIGDVDADLVISVVQFLERQSIIKVLRVGGVDGESQRLGEVAANLVLPSRNLLGNLVRGILHLRFEPVRQAELGKNRMHLRLVLARHSEHIDNMSCRAGIPFFPKVNDGGNFHSRLSVRMFVKVGNDDVVRHIPTLHEHPRLSVEDMEYSDERTLRPLDDFDHISLSSRLFRLLAGHCNPHPVSVERTANFRRPHIDVIFFTVNNYEGISFPSHLHRSLKHGNLPLFADLPRTELSFP